jgi:Glycosyltransferase
VGKYERKLDPLNEETEQFISNHPGILYVGPQNDVRPYLVASDALAFPSYREGFPNVVIQAGAMGLPSIVTNINGCNEIILEGKNGVIIPSKDEFALYNSMIFFLENKDVVQMMASNARSLIVSRYEQSVVWNALLKEYQSLE